MMGFDLAQVGVEQGIIEDDQDVLIDVLTSQKDRVRGALEFHLADIPHRHRRRGVEELPDARFFRLIGIDDEDQFLHGQRANAVD
jgi:hypothetical protein